MQAQGATVDGSSLRAVAPSPEPSALNPARPKELYPGARLMGDYPRPPPYSLPGRRGGSPPEAARKSTPPQPITTDAEAAGKLRPGKSRRSDPSHMKHASRLFEVCTLASGYNACHSIWSCCTSRCSCYMIPALNPRPLRLEAATGRRQQSLSNDARNS